MMKLANTLLVLLAAISLLLPGCASVDKSSAKAQSGAPDSAQVEIVSVPYDPSLPRFVVAVEPLKHGASGRTSGGGYDLGPGHQVGEGVAAQLVTALTHAGNISVVEYDTLRRAADGTWTVPNMQEGEVGPFVIRGTVTEFNETAEAVESSRGGSGARLGWFTRFIGGITGSNTVREVGTGVAIADPTYENKEAKRSGMVGMDLTLVDGRSGRIARGFMCSGTFTTVSAQSGMSVFGIGGSDSAFASSALGQATRAAMNDAVLNTVSVLKTVPR